MTRVPPTIPARRRHRFGTALLAATVLGGLLIGPVPAQAGPVGPATVAPGPTAMTDADGAALAVAAMQPYRRDLFARSATGTLLHRVYQDGAWSDWEDLGGTISSAPAVASWGPGRLDVFARGTDNTLRHRAYAAGAWSVWESLAGALTSAPSVVSTASGKLDVFARGAANALVQRSYTGTWGAWVNLGGTLSSAPTVASWGNGRLDVFARAADNSLQQRFLQGTTWSAWVNLGGVLTSAPAAVAWGGNHLDVLVRGTANTLLHKTYDRSWSALIDRGGPLTSAPAAATGFVDEIDAYALAAAGSVQQRTMPGGWGPLRRLGVITAAVPADPTTFDAVAAAQVRADDCRLGFVLNTGGPIVTSVTRTALLGSAATRHAAAANPFDTGIDTVLTPAFEQDRVADWAEADDIGHRRFNWERMTDFTLPTESASAFQFAPDFYTRLSGFLRDRTRFVDAFYYQDLAPAPGRESIDAADRIAATLDFEDHFAYYQDVDPDDHANADDFRMFLQYGGFPTAAPSPGSTEFRLDVEALKARFASCESTNPVDPHHVLGDEVTAAGLEWQAELDGQAELRNDIVVAQARANASLVVAAEAMSESVGWSWMAGQFVKWQVYWEKQPVAHRPSATFFNRAKAEVTNAQNQAKAQLTVANAASAAAALQATKVTAAQEEAGRIAAANGFPYGRGLAYAQQAAQVTKASAAGALAAAKATQTAVNATLATAAASAALVAAAQAQGHASRAEFLRAAAKEAAVQAHNAALAAQHQADLAAQAAARAKADRATAERAEHEAEVSAARADEQRVIAEREQRTAAAERATADSQRATAARAESQAQNDASTAAARRSDAEAAANTAAQQRSQAEQAEHGAAAARDTAVNAEGRRDSLVARAEAAESREYATEGTDAAAGAREAATRARAAADAATDAAASARSEANTATAAAVSARAAATRATAAADRARAAADRAAAAAAETHAHAQAAHAAAADAIAAAKQAADNVRAAQALVTQARALAAAAKADAVAADQHAAAARADSATATGQAAASAQWAAAARDSAAEVIKPANDAITLGGRYQQTDPSAALAVLVGQSSQTIAQQQAAVAALRVIQANQAAKDAQAAADRADADAKAAAQFAADAAKDASVAAQALERARASAAAAAIDAAAAERADQHAAQLDRQAQADAASADAAADTADSDAAAARDSATDAERDAAGARSSADSAETDAAAARGSADQAEQDATAAETAAQNADGDARDAEDSATRTQQDVIAHEAAAALSASGPSGVENVEAQAVVNDEIVGSGPCQILGDQTPGHCAMQVFHHITGEIIYRLKTCPDPADTYCPGEYSTDYLGSQPVDLNRQVTTQVPILPVLESFWRNLAWGMVSDYVNCATRRGDNWGTACAWAVGSIVIPYGLGKAARLVMTLQGAMRAGIGIEEALVALRDSEISAEGLAGVETKLVTSLVEEEGQNVAVHDLRAKLAELMRRRTLGLDEAIGGKFRRSEMETALRIENERGIRLTRSREEAGDWYDTSGRSYDSVGNFPGSRFDEQWPNLQDQILKHGRKVDLVPIDVSQFTPAQIELVKQFIEPLGSRYFVVGE